MIREDLGRTRCFSARKRLKPSESAFQRNLRVMNSKKTSANRVPFAQRSEFGLSFLKV